MAWPFRVRGGGRGSGSRQPAELGAPRWGREEGPRGRAQASSQLQIKPVPGGGRGRKFRPQRRRLLTLEAPGLSLLVPKRSPGSRGALVQLVACVEGCSREPPGDFADSPTPPIWPGPAKIHREIPKAVSTLLPPPPTKEQGAGSSEDCPLPEKLRWGGVRCKRGLEGPGAGKPY